LVAPKVSKTSILLRPVSTMNFIPIKPRGSRELLSFS
jgi:hypothetical protein